MDNEGGGFFQGKIMGIPMWVVLAGVAVLAYFLLRNSSGTQPTTTGGGGSITTGNTRLDKGAVTVTVNANGDSDTGGGGGHQPKPPVKYTGPVKAIHVKKDESFAQLAADHHLSDETVGDIEDMLQPKGSFAGKALTNSTALKKGQTIYRPIGRGKKEQGL